MTEFSDTYQNWALQLFTTLNIDRIETLDKQHLDTLNEATIALEPQHDKFISDWENALPVERAKFYQVLGSDLKGLLEEFKELPYPDNIYHQENLIEFMDGLINMNLGSPEELLTLELNSKAYADLKVVAQKNIKQIKANHKKEERLHEKTEFAKLFSRTSDLNFLMDLMIVRKLIAVGTCKWINNDSGKFSLLISIIKTIHSKGYLNQSRTLSAKQIEEIAINHFGLEISHSTITKHKLSNTASHDVDFIPLASTLP